MNQPPDSSGVVQSSDKTDSKCVNLCSVCVSYAVFNMTLKNMAGTADCCNEN